jgi:hypothetical protein
MADQEQHEPACLWKGYSNPLEWLQVFAKTFEIHFVDESPSLPSNPAFRDYWLVAIRALLVTFLDSDSSLDEDAFAELVGRVLAEKHPGSDRWTPRLNRRRFGLIDKQIQGTLTNVERVELATLTRMMREQLESDTSRSMDGVRALHRNLMEQTGEDEPS